MSKKDQGSLISSIFEKIHAAGGKQGLKEFVESKGKVAPAVKLSNQEMQLLNGGSMFEFLSTQGQRSHVHNDCCQMGSRCPSLWTFW